MLEEFAPSLYAADGPEVCFYGFPYPTRMALARLADGGLWMWSPVALTPGLAREVEALGPVREIVSPNKIHHLFLAQWAERWPAARLHAPPGLARRKPALHFAAELGEAPIRPGRARSIRPSSAAPSSWTRSRSCTGPRARRCWATWCSATTRRRRRAGAAG